MKRLNPGDCVRCDRTGLEARTRGGLCWWYAKDEPTLPRLGLKASGGPFRGEDVGFLRREVDRLPRLSNPPGRPEYPTLEQCRAAKEQLRSEGNRRPSREKVAERLGVDLKSVKKRAR